MENKISVETISKHLGIRSPRVKMKMEKLNLKLNDQKYLSLDQAIKLLSNYIASNQTSEITKQKAMTLINGINEGKFLVGKSKNSKVKETNGKQKVKRGSKQKRVQWYQKLIKDLYNTVQLLFDECVRLLTSYRFKFLALFIAISVQVHHSANLFYNTAPKTSSSIWIAYAYAIMVDFFIVIIALEKKLAIAKVFAILTFLTNLLYFKVWINFDGSSEAYTNAVASIIISSTIAYTIYAYTDIFVQKEDHLQ